MSFKNIFLSLSSVVLCLNAASLDAQTIETVLGGVDVYRSKILTKDSIMAHHGDLIRSLAQGMGKGDWDLVGKAHGGLMESLHRPGVAAASIGFTMSWEQNKNVVYVAFDIVDQADSAKRMNFAPRPHGYVPDPLNAAAKMQEFMDTAMHFAQTREITPQSTNCPALHCFVDFDHPRLKPYLAIFDSAALKHEAQLIDVVRNDSNGVKRANALFVLAHMKDAAHMIDVLTPSIRDADGTVRNNALRVLMMITLKHPDLPLPVDAILPRLDDPNSAVRDKAAYVVAEMAKRPQYRAAIIAQLPTVLALLHLEQENNHDPAYQILKNLSGLSYGDRDYALWEKWGSTAR